jgi:hypothetical protein
MNMYPQLEWSQTKDYEHRLSCGPFVVAEVFHHAIKSLDKEKPWVVQSLLPGLDIRKELRFRTEDEAKTLAERVVGHWFNVVLRGAENTEVN